MNWDSRFHVQPVLISLGAYIVLHVIFLCLVYSSWASSRLILAVPYISVFGVGLFASHLAGAWRPTQLFCLGILIAVVHGVANFTAGAIGLPTDLGGWSGSLLISTLSSLVVIPLAMLGGGFARVLANDPKF
jgi:hypothetical protein